MGSTQNLITYYFLWNIEHWLAKFPDFPAFLIVEADFNIVFDDGMDRYSRTTI